MRIWRWTLLVVGIEALCFSTAEACMTDMPPPALDGFPKDGSTGVPTNVIPILDRQSAWIAEPDAAGAVFELSSESGEAIAVGPRQSHVWHIELVPSAPLAPGTRYTLRGRWLSLRLSTPVDLSLSFTTGDGPLQTAPPVPIASMQHYTLTKAALSSCDLPRTGTCVAHPTDTFVEHFYLDLVNDPSAYAGTFGVQGPYLYGQSAWTDLSGIDQQTPYQCVRLRTRAADGTYSEPVVLCGKDAPLYRIEGSAMPTCTAQGLAHEGHLVTASEASPETGCSIANARTSDGWLLLLGLAFAFASRRRRA
jgi:MYXO-CTERM domain-containing protein